MEEKYPCPKMTPKQWIENVWYYYKWFILLGIVVISLIGIASFQYFTKVDADAGILYVGANKLSDAQCEQIVESAKKRVPDVNGDGDVGVDITSFVLHSNFDLLNENQKIQAREESQEYSNEILSGDCCILLLDEYFYTELVQNGALVHLYEVFEEMPKSAVDYYGLRLGATELYKEPGFSQLPADTFVCLKFSPVVGKNSEEQRAIQDERNRMVFRELFQDN